MGSKKFVIIVNMFFMMFSLLEAIDINPVCEISICKKDEGKGYKKFLDNIIDNEASNVLYWFSALGFRPIKLENPPNKGYSIHYYYNDGKKSNLKGNNDFIGLCRNWKSLALQGCYTPDTYGRMAVNVANIYSIDTYLKGKKSTLKGLKTFQETLAHELFHGIERGNEKTLLWLSEATSEAVGYAYILEVVKQNKMIKHNETYLNIPFNYSDDKGLCYARYPFFLWLGKDLNPHNIVEYMKNFPRLEGDGLENFQTALKTSGAKTFNILLPLYIAEKINTTKAFYSTESKYNIIGRKASSDFSSPPVIFRKKEENEAIVILNQSIEALTVSPNVLMAEYTNFNDITPQDLLRLVTIRIKAKKGKEDLTLVHEDKVYITDKDEIEQRTVRVLVKADKEVPLGLAKIVNVAKDLTKTEERNFDIEGEDELYDLNYPTCVKASDEIDLSIYALNNLSDALSFPIFNAKKVYLKPNGGKFKKDTTLWTAPSGNGVLDADLIFEDVILHDNKNGKKDKDIEIKNFTKIRYSSSSSGCGAKITLSTGESIIYNADKNTTMMKDGSSTMLLKKPFMYMYEYSEGWCSINFESFSKMMFGGVNSMFGKEKRKEFVQGMVGLANEIGRHSPKAAQEIHKSLKEGAGTKITGSQIILPDGDIITSPQNIKEEFDFYRLPNALNKMLSLKRLRKALKFRRIGEYKGKKYVATPDDVYIKLSRKPCKTEKGKCNFALFGEKNGEKIKIFYNKGNLISTITVEDVVMTFDYGVYDVESVPLRVSSCFDKN